MNMQKYLANLVLSQLKGEKPMNIPDNLNVDDIIDIAVRNHMTYLILGALVRTDNIPADLLRRLRFEIENSVMITLAQVTELKKLVDRFEATEIMNQPMKGARMKFMYPSPEMREMSDIDILVADDQMAYAGKILRSLGYRLDQSVKHHDIYVKQPFLIVEVHRALYDKTVDGKQYSYFKSFERAALSSGRKFTYDFSMEDFYVYMIAHAAKHFYTMGCGIRNLVDIYVFLEKYGKGLDRTYMKKELIRCGIYEFNEQLEKLAYIWLGGRKGNKFFDDLFQYMCDCGIYGKDENGIWHKFSDEKMEGKEVTRAKLKRWYYFPPVFYMAEYYPWLERFPFLLPVAWGIRAFRGAFLKKGAKKRAMVNVIDGKKVKIYQNIYSKMKLEFKR